MSNESDLMTVEQFNNEVRKWSAIVKNRARGTLLTNTHGKGDLSSQLIDYVDLDWLRNNGAAYKVKFSFLKHGVYRAYGAGRGYICVNGVPVRGHRIRSDREISTKTFGILSDEYLRKGYTKGQINRLKNIDTNDTRSVRRKPLNWIDKHIDATIQDLADTVQVYYGDDAMRQVLNEMYKLKIIKK